MVFPITAAIYNFEYSIYLFTCPWDSDNIVVYLTLVFEQVFSMVTVICTATLVNTLIYMYSFGWQITQFNNIDKQQWSNIMIVGGSLYLLNLAKNYSSDDNGTQVMQILFQLFLVVEYFILLYLCQVNINKNIAELRNLIH